MTPLQLRLRALADLLFDARESLTDAEYTWFVGVAAELVGLEAARLFAGEALRATRAKDEAA